MGASVDLHELDRLGMAYAYYFYRFESECGSADGRLIGEGCSEVDVVWVWVLSSKAVVNGKNNSAKKTTISGYDKQPGNLYETQITKGVL